VTFPTGVSLAEVRLPASATWQGGASTITATLTPTRSVIHRDSNTPLVAVSGTATGPSGAGLALLVPHSQQGNFRDAAGNSIASWEYDMVVTYRDVANVLRTVTKQVRIPRSMVALDVLTAVDYGPAKPLAEINVPPRLAEAALNATYGPDSLGIKGAYVRDAIGTFSGTERGEIQFSRVGSAAVFLQANQNPAAGALTPTSSPSLYWPWVLDARAVLGGAALDEFYMYYSTDHEGVHANSGIWLATAPSEIGPWTGRGRVYIDNAGGLQTETPSVIWNPEESLFFMYYQQASAPGAVGQQSTLLATSPDGLTWTRVGIVLDIVSGAVAGDGHTGYFRPYRIGGQWIGYHLMGGTSRPHFGISYSSDGRTWWTDPNPLLYGADQGGARQVTWNTSNIVWWRGRNYWIGSLDDFAAGATPKDGRISIAPIADDGRHVIGVPKTQLYPPTMTYETTNYRSCYAFVGRDGKLYLYYNNVGAFFVAVAGRSSK
jgi:hypothetical protein